MKFAKDFLALAIIFVIVACGLITNTDWTDKRVSKLAYASEE